MKNSNEPRVTNTLKLGLNEFYTTIGKKIVWNISSIIGFGGSAITYLANIPHLRKQFILKEYFPHTLASSVVRNATSLKIDPLKKDEWEKGLQHFKGEFKIQNELPLSSTDSGNELFIYAIDHFSANNTEYIIFDTDGSITLKDYFENLHNEIDKTTLRNDKGDNTHLKVLLQSTITVCNALSALHNRNWLHMDISDTNILIHPKSQKVHLTDLASAVKYDPEKTDYSNVATSYTPSFSPIEQKSLLLGNRRVLLNFECDTYSLCAVLYKCLFNNLYDPILNDFNDFLDDNGFIETPKIPLCPNLSRPLKKKLILILKKGLSGMGHRYKTANELYDDISDLLEKIKKEEASVNKSKQWLIYGCGGAWLAILIFFFSIWLFSARPTISAEIDSIYTKGETIEFDITLYDSTNGSQSLTSDCLDNIKTNGFYASQKEFELVDATDNTSVCRIRLKDISAINNGEKSITIGKIYKSSTALGKYNKPLKLDFYYGENITCDISKPSVDKVNSNSGHSIEYILQFYSPVDFEISINDVGTYGFTAENAVSKNLGNNMISLTFENIVGEPGNDKYFILYESAAADNNLLYSKQTKSPSFSIVEEEISNSIIYVNYSVFDCKIEDGGYVVLSPNILNATEYNYNVTSDDIETVGFSAETEIVGEDIILYNLKAEDYSKEMYINIASDCIIAKNGSTNRYISHKLERIELKDKTIPSLALLRITNDTITATDSVLYRLYIEDDSKNVVFNGNPRDFIELIGFDANVIITITENGCYIGLQDIKPLDDRKEFYIKIKNCIAVDGVGNFSKEIRSKRFKIY